MLIMMTGPGYAGDVRDHTGSRPGVTVGSKQQGTDIPPIAESKRGNRRAGNYRQDDALAARKWKNPHDEWFRDEPFGFDFLHGRKRGDPAGVTDGLGRAAGPMDRCRDGGLVVGRRKVC
jgi:hypothetical protein